MRRLYVVFIFIYFVYGRSVRGDPSSMEADPARIPLYIGGMFSLSGGWDGSGCLVSAELALDQINNRSDILPDYELKMIWNDTKVSLQMSRYHF